VHRQVLQDCLPLIAVLAASFAVLWIVLRVSRLRLRISRLRNLHRCQEGGVQTLSFVITLPIFLMILLFIVQISLHMIGLITVNYAAYAAARSASVWVPALADDRDFAIYLYDEDGDGIPEDDAQNRLPAGLGIGPGQQAMFSFNEVRSANSAKLDEIFHAAALACAPIAPSRDLDGNLSSLSATRADESLVRMYQMLAPSSGSNGRMPQRLRNKLAYSLDNTVIVIRYDDKDSSTGPTYNPRDHDWASVSPRYQYFPNEVGWQDPITVEVHHHFALLPGPGRFLANVTPRRDGTPDRVAALIDDDDGVHKIWITASATMTNEGLQSVRPYVHESW